MLPYTYIFPFFFKIVSRRVVLSVALCLFSNEDPSASVLPVPINLLFDDDQEICIVPLLVYSQRQPKLFHQTLRKCSQFWGELSQGLMLGSCFEQYSLSKYSHYMQ